MILFSRRNRIIKKAVTKTVLEFENKNLKLYDYFYYGAVDISPQNLVVWYLFETDAELEIAISSGLCNELQKATIKNLISFGYPQESFYSANMEIPTEKITFQGCLEEDKQKMLYSLAHRKATVSFTTKEDIDNKANGDYHLYFQ